MIEEAFDRHYRPYGNDGDSNHKALENAFAAQAIAKVWLFTLYLGLGVKSMESILWLTETFYLNNPDIPL